MKPQLDQPETPTLPVRYDRCFGLLPNQQDKAHVDAIIGTRQLGERVHYTRAVGLWCDLQDVTETTEAAEMLDTIASRLTPNTFAAGLGQDMADRLAQRWLDTSTMHQELFDAEVSDLIRRRK